MLHVDYEEELINDYDVCDNKFLKEMFSLFVKDDEKSARHLFTPDVPVPGSIFLGRLTVISDTIT